MILGHNVVICITIMQLVGQMVKIVSDTSHMSQNPDSACGLIRTR